jgi:DNA-binding NarL/FixJ family response regulator
VHDPLTTSTTSNNNQQQQLLHLEALRLGARGVVDPGTPPQIVQATVEGAKRTRGDVEGLVHNLQGAVLHWAQHRRPLLPSTVVLEGPVPAFTSTEQEVLNLLCRGMTDAQMAHSLGLTAAAVGHAARGVMEKLGCDLRGEVIRVALDNDLVTE